MVDLGGEANLWGLEGVVCRKLDRQEEHTVGIRAIRGAHDGGLPAEEVIVDGSCRARGGGITETS